MRNVRESTLAAVNRYVMTTGAWPTRGTVAGMRGMSATKVEERLDALERQGLITRRNGRIVATGGVAQTETM